MKGAAPRTRLQELLRSFQGLKVAVLGDFALDAYWYVDMSKATMSRETPLFNHPVNNETYSLGGAANVAWNLADLGVEEVKAITALGDDWRALLLCDLLKKAGIQADGCISASRWSTALYAKVLLTANNQQQEDARLDFINEQPLAQEAEASLMDQLESCLPGLDALIISDYQPVGVISATMLKRLNALAEQYPRTLFVVDSRERIGQYQNMVLKPNRLEAVHSAGLPSDTDQDDHEYLVGVGRTLQAKAKKPVFITLGEKGCLVIEALSFEHRPGIKVLPPTDTVGAGDAFLASLTASLAVGASSSEAGFIANLASAVTIRKLNVTGTASPSEILALYDDLETSGW